MKQAIVARADLSLGPGKLAAQVAHASLQAYERADTTTQNAWKEGGQKKIVLQGTDEEQLFQLAETAQRNGLAHAIVRDAGHTEVAPGTVTALAVGPDEATAVDTVTGDLALY